MQEVISRIVQVGHDDSETRQCSTVGTKAFATPSLMVASTWPILSLINPQKQNSGGLYIDRPFSTLAKSYPLLILDRE